jgi:hypothetical protein
MGGTDDMDDNEERQGESPALLGETWNQKPLKLAQAVYMSRRFGFIPFGFR